MHRTRCTANAASASPTIQSHVAPRLDPICSLTSKTLHGKKNCCELLGDESQSAMHLTEMISHGVRTYASGFLLQDTKMTLWYADRHGLVRTAPFDIFIESHYLLLVIAAHHYGKAHNFGFSPFLSSPSSSPTPYFETYDGAVLTLPHATSATPPSHDTSADAIDAFDSGTGPLLG